MKTNSVAIDLLYANRQTERRNGRDNNVHHEFIFASAEEKGSNTSRGSRRHAKCEFPSLVGCELESLSYFPDVSKERISFERESSRPRNTLHSPLDP
jgi:hypothetical protein